MSLQECQVTSNQLQNTAVGKKIIKTIANQNPHGFVWFATEPQYAFKPPEISCKQAEQYDKLLTGKKIWKSTVLSNFNYLYVGNRALMFNTLSTRYYGVNDKQPKRHQLYLLLDDGSALAFCGSLGGPLFLFEVDEDGWAINWRNDFPSVLSDDFTETFFFGFYKEYRFNEIKTRKKRKMFSRHKKPYSRFG